MTSNNADSFRNVTKYTGQNYRFTPTYVRSRDPTGTDLKDPANQGYYPINSLWTNKTNQNLWCLVGIISNVAKWVMLGSSTGPAVKFPVPAGTSPVVADGSGNVTLTSSDNTVTITGGTNTIDFKSNASSIVESLTPNVHTPPGTSPVLPASGTITLEGGATFATNTQAQPIRTNSLAANKIDFEVQLAGANAGASTANKFGVSQFDSNQFSVTSGFVQLAGGGGAALQQFTTDDSLTETPTGSPENVNVNGAGGLKTYQKDAHSIGIYGNGANGTILQGKGTSSATPAAFTTATYPSTTTSQQILYSTATNTVGELTTANSTLPATNSSGTLAMRAFSTNIQFFSGSGTYTPSTGMLYCIIECLGGGAGGGGVANPGGAGNYSIGDGGGSGAYSRGSFSAATIGGSQTVTVGSGGAGGVGNATGTGGGTSSVGVLITAPGGSGGGGGTAQATTVTALGAGGDGGIAGSGGSLNTTGNKGGGAIGLGSGIFTVSGRGAFSGYGQGGGPVIPGNNTTVNGSAGTGYGSGGSGAASMQGASAGNGGAGKSGFVLVTEYIIN